VDQCGAHVLDGGQFVAAEVELAFVEGIGELGGLLD
jgi:hypothetical protein